LQLVFEIDTLNNLLNTYSQFLNISEDKEYSIPKHHVCEHHKLNIKCEENHIIKVKSAHYGRLVSTFQF